MMREMQRTNLRSRRMEQQWFNKKTYRYTAQENVFWKGLGDELTWQYDLDIEAYSIEELLDILSTALHMTGRQYEWCVDRLGPFFWVRYKDENHEEVMGKVQVDADIPTKEIIADLLAYGKEFGLYVMGS